jgi:hypothetical protein
MHARKRVTCEIKDQELRALLACLALAERVDLFLGDGDELARQPLETVKAASAFAGPACGAL